MVTLIERADKDLMELIKIGNHQAFTALVQRYGEYFYKLSYHYVVNKSNAEDIVQQAFLKLWEAPYKYNSDKASFKVWFCRVIINQSIDFIRKNKPTTELDEQEFASNNESIETQLTNQRKESILEKSISLLPFNQRTAINLVVYKEMKYEEAATIMKIRTGALKSLLVRAKNNIKKYIGEDYNV